MNRFHWQTVSLRNPYLFALALLVIVLAANLAVQPNLISSGAVNDNMRVFLPTILLAAGQAVVILGGGIDISVGSIVSIINVILATQLGADASPQKTALFILIALVVGAAAGAVNGFFVAILRLQPIITTYATSFLFAGVALYILPEPGGTVPVGISSFYRNTTPLGLSLGFFVILVVLLLWYFLSQTRYGRYLYAMGGKPDAAYESGVPVSLVQFSTYVISGLMAATAGIAVTLLAGAGNAAIGDALTLTAVTAVVVGGTALSGGVGGIAGPIMGAIVLGLIRNIISFANVDLWWQTFVNAAIIVVALAMPGFINLLRRLRR
jgi:ribose transport system permease protein